MTTSKAAAETPEELVEHLRGLIAEAEKTLREKVGDQTDSRLTGLYARLGEARDRIEELYGQARDKVVAGARSTDEAIRAHPYQSMAVALGVGVLLGALVGRAASKD